MEVKLLNHTPLPIADIAICKCYGNEPHSDKEKVKARINRVANVSKHASTIEHLNYSFDIDGISRACLQELARHRIASYTVKSSRYTLQELKNEDTFIWKGRIASMFGDGTRYDTKRASKFVVLFGDKEDGNLSLNQRLNSSIVKNLENLRLVLQDDTNDRAKYCMPEAYKTSLVMTINARALQNFLELRSSKHALWEIQLLAKAIYDVIPNDHKFLYDYIFKDNNEK